MDKAEQEQVANYKAEAISSIANSQHFIVITDNGKNIDNLHTDMMVNNPITALEFLKILKQLEFAILNPKKSPPSSSIVKP